MKVQQGEYLILNVTALGSGIGAIWGNSVWNVLYRMVDTAGNISTNNAQFTLTPRTDAGGGQLFQANGTVPSIQLTTSGELVSVVVNTDTMNHSLPAIYQGVAYVQVFVSPIPQVTMDKSMSAMLIAETLSSEYSCAWPGNLLQKPTDGQGYPVNLMLGDPGTGLTFQYKFSRQFRIKLKKVLFQLSKGPGDAALVPYVGVANSDGKFHTVMYAPAAQPVSTTYWYQFAAGLPATVTGFGMSQGLPADLLLAGSKQTMTMEADLLWIGWSGGQGSTMKISNVAIGLEVWNEYD